MNTKIFLAGIDIGATNIKYGLVEENGEVVFRSQVQTPDGDKADKIYKAVLACGEQLLIEADDQEGHVEYLGVGSPGTVDTRRGKIDNNCPNLPGWIGFPLRDRLRDALNLPIYVDNDANCAALGEALCGAGRGIDNLICLTIGTGLGGGIIIKRHLYHGHNDSAGEIGQILVPGLFAGEIVRLEELVSSKGILNRLKRQMENKASQLLTTLCGNNPEKLTIRKVFTAVGKGDETAQEVVADTARRLGQVLAGLVNFLNPGCIILGGGVVEGGSFFVDIVRESVMKDALTVAARDLKVVAAELGNAAGFIGAAFLGRENLSD